MSTIKSFILGMLIMMVGMGAALASYSVQPLSKADAKAYAKIEKYVIEAESLTGESAELVSAVLLKESRFGQNTVNPYSNVKGAMQYTNRQWRNDVHLHAKRLGLSAKSSVHDKRANILIGAAGLAENRSYLERKTKRAISDGDVYMSWFVGLYGAEKILKGNDNAKISKYVKLTKGNWNMYTVNGKVATVKQFRNKMNQLVNNNKKKVSYLVNQSKMDNFIIKLQVGNTHARTETAMLF